MNDRFNTADAGNTMELAFWHQMSKLKGQMDTNRFYDELSAVECAKRHAKRVVCQEGEE